MSKPYISILSILVCITIVIMEKYFNKLILLQISAQESRRKKKEYMDQLERKVEILISENTDYRKRVETLEQKNASLLSQVASLQAMVARGRKWRAAP